MDRLLQSKRIRTSNQRKASVLLGVVTGLLWQPDGVSAWTFFLTESTWTPRLSSVVSQPRGSSLVVLHAKRNKRAQARQDEADLNRWYESVDTDKSPDDIFWEEMERQRLLNSKTGDDGSGVGGVGSSPYGSISSGGTSDSMNTAGVSQQTLAKTNSLIAIDRKSVV